jgi:DNA (cytosine-5)-methyltransferase 1
MIAISLFAGAGGLDIGCEAAGFTTVAAVECNPTARATLLANRPQFFRDLREEAILDDVREIDVAALRRVSGTREGEVDLVHGGPPCTPFSKSGNWLEYKRAGADPNASLLDHFVETVGGLRPKAFLMENVYGLAYRNQNRRVFDRFRLHTKEAGYALDWRVVLAADYGVPQLRQRLICIGVRQDLLGAEQRHWRFPWPTPSHAGPHETRQAWDANLPRHLTAGEALSTLTVSQNPPEPEELVSGTYADELAAIPPGQNYLFWTAERGHRRPRFRWRSRYWNFLLKLHPDRPSPTIQGQPGPWVGPFHWENRRLRVAEVKRLMTFPDEFIVLGTRREQQLQLGNAVPPTLAKVLASALRDELAGRCAIDSPASVAAAA